MATFAPGCSPGIVPCAPGFRWDSVLCRCVNYDPKSGGIPLPGGSGPIVAPAATTTPWYKKPIVLLAGGALVLYLFTKS